MEYNLPTNFNIAPSIPLEKLNKQELVPKEETQVLSFLKKNPNFDGRNTVVAILDTGVDPGAAGLQLTSDGKPKIIDIVDCTGSGDVIISKEVVKVDADNSIVGLTGKTLYLNKQWKNPAGEYFLGVKNINELYPGNVADRVSKFNLEKQTALNNKLVEKVKGELATLTSQNDDKQDKSTIKDRKIELEAQNYVLDSLVEQYSKDNNPLLDVIVFYDGENHRVAVDWNQNGDLKDSEALTDYFIERKYWPVNYKKEPYELLNINVKIYAEGKLISLVSSAGTHATHVAGILASHHPEDTSLDGVAPGAQIVSLKIGESRLGSMETQIGLTRAISALNQHQCDLANMSYGEANKLPNQGRFIKWLSDEIIRRNNCIFVSSAGNEGPALSTVGSPGGTSADIIGVGAYVNHSMMKTDYSALEYSPEMAYSWSSRGPTTDGDVGVDIYAPGGAITSVPTYILYKSQLMNGTSMSSPNLCGCLSLLVSALKQQDIKYTSYRVQHAIKNTSKPFPLRSSHDKVSKAGIIQVEKAWEYLKAFRNEKDLDTRPEITITNHKNRRGVYLREKEESLNPFFANVSIAPKFLNYDSKVFGNDININKYELEMYLSLQASESFIKVPEVVAYNNGGRSFTLKVDPTTLEPGYVYQGEVQGWDNKDFNKGPMLKIPITIIKPLILTTPNYKLKDFKVSPGSVLRRFISVPENATYCEMKITSTSSSNYPVRMYAHMIQLLQDERFTEYEHKYMLSFNSNSSDSLNESGNQQISRSFKVIGGKTLEICLVQFWANTGDQQFNIEFEFHGVKLMPFDNINNNLPLILDSSSTTHRLDLVSSLRRESNLKVNANLEYLQKTLIPIKANISPLLSERDLLPPNQQRLYQLVLEYELPVNTFETPATISFKYPSAMQKFLYDSFLDGFFILIYNAFGKPISYDEVSPRQHTLPFAGDYKIKLQLNHTDVKILENIKKTLVPLLAVRFKLPNNKQTNLSAYSHPHAAYSSSYGSTLNSFELEKNDWKPIYLKSISYPEDIEAKVGDLLLGKINLNNNDKLPVSERLSFGVIIPPKVDLKDLDEVKPVSNEEVFSTDQDILEFKMMKSKLEVISNAKDNEWKLQQLDKVLELDHLEFKSNNQDQQIQKNANIRYQLEILNQVIDILLPINKLNKLPEYDHSNYDNLINKVYKYTNDIIDVNEVIAYFNLKEADNKKQSLFELKRSILDKNNLLYLSYQLYKAKDDQQVIKDNSDIKNLLNLVLSNTTGLSKPNDFILLIIEVNYHQLNCDYGLAFKKVIEYLKTKFKYTSKNEDKFKYLLNLQITLADKLGYSNVWNAYLKNHYLNQFPKKENEILG